MNVARRLLSALLGSRLPTVEGELAVAGASAPISVTRDTWGIPHIEAEGDADAWYGLGFCQGQDRTFQLEVLWRVVRGRLAELVGTQGIAVDRLSRRVGFRRAAQAQIATLDGPDEESFAAFVRGVNDGATVGRRHAPHELALLRRRRSAWDVADVLAVTKLIGFTMGTNWGAKLGRLRILRVDGAEALAAVEPAYAPGHPLSSPPGADAGPAADRLAEDLAVFGDLLGTVGASNNWAIGGDLAEGSAIVANDPHLDASVPPHWYLAHLATPEWAVAGAAFAGSPGIAAGHNGHGAWGTTNGAADFVDLYVEEIGPDGAGVREGDAWVPCEVIREVIEVRGGESVTEDVLVTPRGPLVSPALDGETAAISYAATWLQPAPMRGYVAAVRARSFEEFRRCFAHWPSASFNLVYGDGDGVPWQFVGTIPRRRKGHGLLPLPASAPDVGWEAEPVAFDELPFTVAGRSGVVATANNQPVADGDGPYLGAEWTAGYRAARIFEVLRSRDGWDRDASMALQMDDVSLVWREVCEAFLSAPAADPDAATALDLLRSWDGHVGRDSPAAAVFELAFMDIQNRVVAADAPRTWEYAVGRSVHPLAPVSSNITRRWPETSRLLREQPAGVLAGPWGEEIAAALARAVGRLRHARGDDATAWGWGHVRPLTWVHPLGRLGPLGPLFNLGPYPWGGDTTTVSMCTSDPFDFLARPIMVATLRMTVEIGAWDDARFVLPGGQSGNPLSVNYDDQMPLWLRGDGVPIPWSPEQVAAAARSRLRLVPGDNLSGRAARRI